MTFTYLEVIIALVTQLTLIYQCHHYKDVLYRGLNNIFLRWFSLTVICLALSMIFHPGKKGSFFFTLQMFVSFTMFLEAAALIPQLVHIHLSKDTEGLNSYYLYCLGLARVGRVFFWLTMSTKRETFWYLMLADILHTILLGLFFYVYRQARMSKDNSVLGFRIDMKNRSD